MEKQFKNGLSHYMLDKYHKALARFERGLQSKRFANYTERKKRQIWNRLCRYARQVGIVLKPNLVTACLAMGLCLSTPALAQTFTEQIGAANPFNGVNAGFYSNPTFEDIDNDGDKDAFSGVYGGTILYYKNTGTASAPVFTAQTGAANPFNGVDVGYNSTPTFVDIDNDGDKDAFIGERFGTIKYYKNTGTASAPVFTAQTGAANPFNGVDVGYNSILTFVDIDNDGDKDAFSGVDNGTILYYKNTGTASVPVFTAQIGAANPFNGVDIGSYSTPTFEDIDNDGDKDAFIGEHSGTIKYYKNTGTGSVPVFTEQIGVLNPFDGVDVGTQSTPTYVDIDNDGDKDAFIGAQDGTIKYFKNAPIVLPVELLHFSARNQGAANVLYWETANEVHNKGFQIERLNPSTQKWDIIGFKTTNYKASSYNFMDSNTPLPISYYRLRQIDNDGQETLSKVVSVAVPKLSKLKAYPSVSSGVLTLEGVENSIFHIYNLLGQVVITGKTAQQIDVSALAQGTYILKVGEEQVTFMKK